eukprot:scpid13879/ scgid20015/ 
MVKLELVSCSKHTNNLHGRKSASIKIPDYFHLVVSDAGHFSDDFSDSAHAAVRMLLLELVRTYTLTGPSTRAPRRRTAAVLAGYGDLDSSSSEDFGVACSVL